MTTKTLHGSLTQHLRRLHTHAQNVEEPTRSLIQAAEKMEPEVVQSEKDKAEFEDALADLNARFQVFSDRYANLLLEFKFVTSHSKEIKEMLNESLANKISDAVMLGENMDILAQVDHIFLANQVAMVLDQGTVEMAVKELLSRGEEGREKLEWLSEALQKNGY